MLRLPRKLLRITATTTTISTATTAAAATISRQQVPRSDSLDHDALYSWSCVSSSLIPHPHQIPMSKFQKQKSRTSRNFQKLPRRKSRPCSRSPHLVHPHRRPPSIRDRRDRVVPVSEGRRIDRRTRLRRLFERFSRE